ncbi:site-specific integrase [Patescibacteria group bacterium]|nr:site-specific integrase [Patescibacteria group bacterium]
MNLLNEFKNHLLQNSSKATAKNYLSDLNNYFAWFTKTKMINPLSDPDLFFKTHSFKTLREYKESLIEIGVSSSTIKRRFAALKRFDQFSFKENLSSSDPMSEIKSISLPKDENILLGFKKYLEKEKNSQSTIKNYISDINHFLNWTKSN